MFIELPYVRYGQNGLQIYFTVRLDAIEYIRGFKPSVTRLRFSGYEVEVGMPYEELRDFIINASKGE